MPFSIPGTSPSSQVCTKHYGSSFTKREKGEITGEASEKGASVGGEVDGASLIVTVAAAGMFLGFLVFFFGWQGKKTRGAAV